MRRNCNGKALAAILLAASMMSAACGNKPKTTAGEEVKNEAAATGKEQSSADADDSGQESSGGYALTEENDNPEMTMNRQPESSYWFPAQLLEWKAEEDADLIFNVSTVPLAERVPAEELETVNETQNKDTKVMAVSIMNGSTSGNSPHGLNKMNANTFSYWQYVDTLVYWGGSSGEGLIVAPSPDVVDAGHKHGVKVIGTIFMPQAGHGGKMEWLDDLLTEKDGSFPVADKLIEVANTYGFDGWFMNQETEGTDDQPLTKEHADKMKRFLSYYKEKAPQLQLVYYDSMTVDGKMDWQNALTKKNAAYLTGSDSDGADEMFLNFWWTEDKLAKKELLKSSAKLAEKLGINPYDLYAGVDVQSNGYDTPIKWNLFENPQGGTYTSLGLYCPSWAYFSAGTVQDFWKQENRMWVNAAGDPSASKAAEVSDDTKWKGVSAYVTERTAITKLPFVTNFSTGNGYGFYKNGELISQLDWNNRSVSDVLPTYRYIFENGEGNQLTADLDVGDAYYGGNSLIVRGTMKKDVPSVMKLYSAKLPACEQMIFTTAAKTKGAEIALDAVLTLDDGTQLVLEGDQKVGEEWTTVTYDTSELAGKTIRTISYRLTSAEDVSGLQFRFGNITMVQPDTEETAAVSDVQVLDSEFDEDAMYAGVRLSWKSDAAADYYEVYRINQDQTKSLLGVSNTESFYVNTLPRTDETNKSTFRIVPVNALLKEGTGSEATMEWPDNSLPKAAFTADVTLAKPGDKITFTSLCSPNTEKVTWTLTGSDTESAEGDTVTVSYAQEGVYPVALKAENSSGSADASDEAYIVITNQASDGLQLLSQGAATEADTFVNENEAPEFAVDGDKSKKWCATGSAPHEITIDLGSVQAVSAVDMYHAEAGGESADMNTKSYEIYTSEDGAAFEKVRGVTKNTAGSTHDAFAPVNAQFVKVVILKPTQGSDSAARIYEVEVYGLNEKID